VGARKGSKRVQTRPDPGRRSQNLLAGEGLPARLTPTVADTPKFPDTEEVTGVDGAEHQLDLIRSQAQRRGVTIHIVTGLIHVLEYIWKAA
jgi:hypothetical protein